MLSYVSATAFEAGLQTCDLAHDPVGFALIVDDEVMRRCSPIIHDHRDVTILHILQFVRCVWWQLPTGVIPATMLPWSMERRFRLLQSLADALNQSFSIDGKPLNAMYVVTSAFVWFSLYDV